MGDFTIAAAAPASNFGRESVTTPAVNSNINNYMHGRRKSLLSSSLSTTSSIATNNGRTHTGRRRTPVEPSIKNNNEYYFQDNICGHGHDRCSNVVDDDDIVISKVRYAVEYANERN